MAWIESHQSLERHPKRADLSARMQWSKPETIGRLHMFWWWVLDFAEDGDLRKYNDSHIAEAMCVDIDHSAALVEALVQARWLERKPYFRVRNWYGYVWRFLHVKYGKTGIDRIRQIKAAYADSEPDKPPENIEEFVTAPVTAPLIAPITALTNQPTNQPRQRVPARAREAVELPAGFPASEADAKAAAAFVGCTEDFAVETWNKARGRGGRDAKDVPIRSWRHYLKSEANFQKNRTEKEKYETRKNNRSNAPDRNAGTYNAGPLSAAAKSKVR